MHLDRGRVQRHGLKLDADDLLDLQLLEHPVQNLSLRSSAHPHMNGVPATESLRQAAPFTALLGRIQQCIEHLEVAQAHVPTLHRQRTLDPLILRFC